MKHLINFFPEAWSGLDWLFWILTFVIAIFTIAFGFVSSYQATKANEEIKKVTEEMHFMSAIRNDIYYHSVDVYRRNDDVLDDLNDRIVKTWSDYRKESRYTRLSILPHGLQKAELFATYKEAIIKFSKIQEWSYEEFKKIVNLPNFKTNKKISKVDYSILLNYHHELKKNVNSIIDTYNKAQQKE